MNNINLVKKWKKYLKEETDLALSSASRKDLETVGGGAGEGVNPTVETLREVLDEVQEMAMRLIEIQEELKRQYKNDEITYYPGREFQIAARKLADASEYSSLATSINRYIENEVGLKNLNKDLKNKIDKNRV